MRINLSTNAKIVVFMIMWIGLIILMNLEHIGKYH